VWRGPRKTKIIGKELENKRQEDKKRRRRRYLGQVKKNRKVAGSGEESRQGNGKGIRIAGGNEKGNYRGNKGAEKREPRSQERNRTTKGRI
jgi:hypothetical protein